MRETNFLTLNLRCSMCKITFQFSKRFHFMEPHLHRLLLLPFQAMDPLLFQQLVGHVSRHLQRLLDMELQLEPLADQEPLMYSKQHLPLHHLLLFSNQLQRPLDMEPLWVQDLLMFSQQRQHLLDMEPLAGQEPPMSSKQH